MLRNRLRNLGEPMGLPRFARNDTFPSVFARHDSAEAILGGKDGEIELPFFL